MKSKKLIVLHWIVWIILLPFLVSLSLEIRYSLPQKVSSFFVMALCNAAVFAVAVLISPLLGYVIRRFRLRRYMTVAQVRALRKGTLSHDIICEARLLEGEKCYYSAGAIYLISEYSALYSKPIYGKIVITNLRIIFLQKWHGFEVPLSGILTCRAARGEVDIQTRACNWNLSVRYTKEVVMAIDKLRYFGDDAVHEIYI